ncbi:MAG TPA: histidine phosphatase family protein [Opitutales bacterium]|jgi:broad specificity phosphatase PhoE|nr:histidine phosphatase family protein [Opitutales bacterium]
MPRLFLIRHGETAWSLSGQHTSRTDLPLTDNGRAAAAKLPARLAKYSFALVLTSPRLRARETAKLAGFPNAEVCEDLREFDYGEYEGLTKAQIRAKAPGWNSVLTDPCPGGETPAQVAARAQRVAARVRATNGDCLVFTHGHLGRILAACWLGQPPIFAQQFSLDTTTLSILGDDGGRAYIQAWNCGAENEK